MDSDPASVNCRRLAAALLAASAVMVLTGLAAGLSRVIPASYLLYAAAGVWVIGGVVLVVQGVRAWMARRNDEHDPY